MNICKRKFVSKRHVGWNIANQQIQILQDPLEKFWDGTPINTFSKQSLNVELCKVSKGEEKEVHSCNTNSKI